MVVLTMNGVLETKCVEYINETLTGEDQSDIKNNRCPKVRAGCHYRIALFCMVAICENNPSINFERPVAAHCTS
jgi:hypothetical protein